MISRVCGLLGTGLFLLLSVSCPAVEWHHPLSQDGGGVWRQRIPITVTNPTDRAFRASLCGSRWGPGASLWIGMAESVRVCDSRGQELLFALTDGQALPVTRGPVPMSGYLTIPVECPAHQSATSYVYFDNPSAGELPDFLADHATPGQRRRGAGPGSVAGRVEA